MLYYGRPLDHTILPALNDIASEHSIPTQRTKENSQQVLDYVTTYPNAYILYYASDVISNIDSGAAYLMAKKTRSRVAGYYHLSYDPKVTEYPPLNGLIHNECETLYHVVSSALEAEAGVFFVTLK